MRINIYTPFVVLTSMKLRPMNRKILHLFDDEKVVNRTIESFEKVFPGRNVYCCFVDGQPQKVSRHEHLYWVGNASLEVKADLSDVAVVVIHLLSYKKCLFVEKHVKPGVPVYWLMWGADYYNMLLGYRGFRMFYQSRFLGFRYDVKKLLYKLGYKNHSQKVYEQFIQHRVTHCVTNKFDFALCKQYGGILFDRKINVRTFFYYPIDKILGKELMQKEVCGNVILIGNSSSVTNNHCYAFEYLKKMNLDGRVIVTPLNYGANTRYKEYVIKKGKEYFRDKYRPLLEFLPLDEYNRLLLKAEICIFPHWRQEGNGNIIIALYLGAKVFMSNRSSLFSYYKDMGLVLYELEKIDSEQLRTPLDSSVRKRNREILIERYHLDAQLTNIRKIWGTYLEADKQAGV